MSSVSFDTRGDDRHRTLEIFAWARPQLGRRQGHNVQPGHCGIGATRTVPA